MSAQLAPPPATFGDNADSARSVLAHLPYEDLVACRGACTTLRKLASEEHLWQALCGRHFWASTPTVPSPPCAPCFSAAADDNADGLQPVSRIEIVDTWMAAFPRWLALAKRVEGGTQMDAPTWTRVAEAWGTMEVWLEAHAPEIKATLRPPALRLSLARVRCAPLRYLYAVHDGQDLAFDRARLEGGHVGQGHIGDIWLGIFGGYSAYNNIVCMRLHPIHYAEKIQDIFRQSRASWGPSDLPHTLFSTNYNMERVFAADDDGGVWYQVTQSRGWARAGPNLVDWFAEYARRLREGVYRKDVIYHGDGARDSRGIVLFPDQVDGDVCTQATTQGIEVRASAVYTPESRQSFAYSLRMRMASGAPVQSAQLFRRFWEIDDGSGGDPSRVVGEGVIGKFPVLHPGGYRDDEQARRVASVAQEPTTALHTGEERAGWFVYQSMSGPMASEAGGRFGGEVEFVPGTLAEPSGPPFRVKVAPFALRVPEFVY